jgi:hypothetical protein
MNAQTKFRTCEFLLATYLLTGSGLAMHGAYTMDGANILFGCGLLLLATAIFVAMVFEVDNAKGDK